MNYITDPHISPYKIGLDENQYVIVKVFTTEKGKQIGSTYEQVVGYYVSFGACLTKLSVLLTMDNNYNSIQEYLQALKDVYDNLINNVKEVGQ